MELLIAILVCMGVYATPELLNNEEYVSTHRESIDYGNRVIENRWYYYNEDGGIVIDPGVGS
jgi:hypothetical protein